MAVTGQESNKKLLIVTGGSRGIGEAIAQQFLHNDYRVLNLSRRPCEIEGVINLSWDLAQPQWSDKQCEKLSQLASQAPQICLVHNAALFVADSIEDQDPEKLRQVLEVNVVAPQRLNSLLLPYMQPGSSILYIGSTLAEKAVSNRVSYVVSKHAGIGMMRANCQDLAGREIHTANICPGFTNTAMLQQHFQGDPDSYQQLCQQIAFGRLVQPNEVAKLTFFCAESPIVNGAVYHANLGQIER